MHRDNADSDTVECREDEDNIKSTKPNAFRGEPYAVKVARTVRREADGFRAIHEIGQEESPGLPVAHNGAGGRPYYYLLVYYYLFLQVE